MAKHVANILSVFVTEVEEQLKQQEEQEQQQRLTMWMEQLQYKEHKQPHFDGEAKLMPA